MADEQTEQTTETTATETTATETSTATETTETPVVTTDDGTVLGGPDADAAAAAEEARRAALTDDERKAEDDAAAAAEAAKNAPPEKYELVLKDADGNDVPLDSEALAEAEPVLRDLGLSNEQANKLLPVAKALTDRTQATVLQQIADAGAAQKKAWFDEYKADPEIGGAKAEETEHLAAKGLDALGYAKDHEFRKLLTDTGFGNNVHMIRAFAKIGALVGEDGTFARPNAGPEPEPAGHTSLYKD